MSKVGTLDDLTQRQLSISSGSLYQTPPPPRCHSTLLAWLQRPIHLLTV